MAAIKQFITPSRPLFYMKERATWGSLALVAYDCKDDQVQATYILTSISLPTQLVLIYITFA
jgi:hypothetical protein